MGYMFKMVNGKRRDVHRMVMEDFLGRKLSRNEVVHHINGNVRDNRAENLQVMTLHEHSRLHQQGEKAPSCRLNEENVASIREIYNIGFKNIARLSRLVGVSRESIADIIKNRTWKHIL